MSGVVYNVLEPDGQTRIIHGESEMKAYLVQHEPTVLAVDDENETQEDVL
jgi:hypothetical protein